MLRTLLSLILILAPLCQVRGQILSPILAGSAAAASSFPVNGVLDTFTRANENPLANGHWSCPSNAATDTPMAIVSNAAVGTSGGGNNCYWSSASFGPKSEAYVTVSTKPGNCNCVFVMLNEQNPASANFSGYYLSLCPLAGTDSWTIYKVTNGAFTSLSSSTHEIASGDSLGLSQNGTTLTAYTKTGAGAWSSLFSTTDGTYTSTGRISFGIDSSANGGFTNFGGGSF